MPLHGADHGLGERLGALGELSNEDQASLLKVLDALVAKSRLKAPSPATSPDDSHPVGGHPVATTKTFYPGKTLSCCL